MKQNLHMMIVLSFPLIKYDNGLRVGRGGQVPCPAQRKGTGYLSPCPFICPSTLLRPCTSFVLGSVGSGLPPVFRLKELL